MSDSERSSTMGPAVFFGLLVYALATYSPPDVTYANPAESLVLEDVTSEASMSAPQTPTRYLLPQSPEPRHMLRRSDGSGGLTEDHAERRFSTPDPRHPSVVGDFQGSVRPLPAVLDIMNIATPNTTRRQRPSEPAELMLNGDTGEKAVTRGSSLPSVRGVFWQDVGLANHGAGNLRLNIPRFVEQRPSLPLDRLIAPHPGGLRPDSPMMALETVSVDGDNVHLREGRVMTESGV